MNKKGLLGSGGGLKPFPPPSTFNGVKRLILTAIKDGFSFRHRYVNSGKRCLKCSSKIISHLGNRPICDIYHSHKFGPKFIFELSPARNDSFE